MVRGLNFKDMVTLNGCSNYISEGSQKVGLGVSNQKVIIMLKMKKIYTQKFFSFQGQAFIV